MKVKAIYRLKGDFNGQEYSNIILQVSTEVKNLLAGEPTKTIKIKESKFNEILQAKNMKVTDLREIKNIYYDQYGRVEELVI